MVSYQVFNKNIILKEVEKYSVAKCLLAIAYWKGETSLCRQGPSSQSYGFSSSHVWMWELDHEESWALKNWCLKLWCWRRLLRVPWTARRSNQSILKGINPEYSLEGLTLMLKLKLQYFGHLMQRADWLEKTLMLGKIEGKRRRVTEDEIVGWYHWLSKHEFEQTPVNSEGQERPLWCSSWGHKKLDTELPRWFSGKRSTCQCNRHGIDHPRRSHMPWSS